MQFVVWGAGRRCKYIFYYLGRQYIAAVIDQDVNKIGNSIDGVPIISFDDYLSKYQEYIVIVSTHEFEIEKLLLQHGISSFFSYRECPGEIQWLYPGMGEYKNIYKRNLLKMTDKHQNYVICGNNFFSFILYFWLRDNGINVSIYNNVFNDAVKDILYKQNELSIIETIDAERKIVVSSAEVPDCVTGEYNHAFFASEHMVEYKNRDILVLKNVYKKRKRCFVVGLGPSLREDDLEVLRKNHEFSISMNHIYKLYHKVKWRPDCYVAIDEAVNKNDFLERSSELFADSMCFIGDSVPFTSERSNKYICFHHNHTSATIDGSAPFSSRFDQIAYAAGTVTYVAMQLAVYLGFKEIILLGVDATGINSEYSTYGHFYDEKSTVAVCIADCVKGDYHGAKKYADTHDIKIYNATRGGELEIFERVEFDKLF